MRLRTSNIKLYIKLGSSDKHWYRECRKTLIKIFGEQKLWLVCNLLAATSINSTLKSNISLFKKALHQLESGKPITGYVPVMLMQVERIREGKPISGRKIRNFAAAMFGDPDAVVVDTWILRAFGQGAKRKVKDRLANSSASKKQYDEIEQWITKQAIKMDIDPAQLCAMIWGGIRKHQTGDQQTRYCEILINSLTSPLFDGQH
jgi:hypothetical protein